MVFNLISQGWAGMTESIPWIQKVSRNRKKTKSLEFRKCLETGKTKSLDTFRRTDVRYNSRRRIKNEKYISNMPRSKFKWCYGAPPVVHHPSTNQYIGVQASQEKLPGNFNVETLFFRVGGRLMHFNLSVFSHASLFSTVLLKWNYYALAYQYIDHWPIQGRFQINLFIDFKNHPT